jgi:hypothetical protein
VHIAPDQVWLVPVLQAKTVRALINRLLKERERIANYSIFE